MQVKTIKYQIVLIFEDNRIGNSDMRRPASALTLGIWRLKHGVYIDPTGCISTNGDTTNAVNSCGFSCHHWA